MLCAWDRLGRPRRRRALPSERCTGFRYEAGGARRGGAGHASVARTTYLVGVGAQGQGVVAVVAGEVTGQVRGHLGGIQQTGRQVQLAVGTVPLVQGVGGVTAAPALSLHQPTPLSGLSGWHSGLGVPSSPIVARARPRRMIARRPNPSPWLSERSAWPRCSPRQRDQGIIAGWNLPASGAPLKEVAGVEPSRPCRPWWARPCRPSWARPSWALPS